jgi:hypothetical protein
MRKTSMRSRRPEVLARAARDRVARSLESQINLSVFLGVLVLTVFVMPALGLASYHQGLYNNIVFSVLLVTGILVGSDEPRLFPVAVCTGIIAFSVTWASWWIPTNSLELWRDAFTVLAVVIIQWVLMRQIADLSSGAHHHRPYPGRDRGVSTLRHQLGIRLRDCHALKSSRVSEHDRTVPITCRVDVFQLRHPNDIGLWRDYPAEHSCPVAGHWRGIDRATLSRRVACEIGSDGNYVSEGRGRGGNVTESRGSCPTDATAALTLKLRVEAELRE